MSFASSFALLLAAPAALVVAQSDPLFSAPPPNPPPVTSITPVEPRLSAFATVYTIGDPTPEEQLYVEMINRARANPQAEAQLFATTTDADVLANYRGLNVDTSLMVAQFATIQPAQPLAINPRLTAAARRHTQDMFANVFQGHDGTDGSNAGTRAQAAGYAFFTLGENVFSQAQSVFHGHAGFEVDWGFGLGGMQTPPGHRNTIHNAVYREIGVGVVLGSNTKAGKEVGPQLVTQEFGVAQGATPFITGVAYYDLNGNSFYDAGEGIGGVSVKVSGVPTEGITATSGGYAVPIPGNGTFTVTFSGAGFTPVTRTVTVANLANRKLDFIPVYTIPFVSGPASPAVGRSNNYSISQVGGAAEYHWRSFKPIAVPLEGAENGSVNVTVDQSSGYNVLQTDVKASGSAAFRLAHPEPRRQVLALRPTFFVKPNGALTFMSRHGFSSPDQIARVQVSLDGGVWTDLFTQAGKDNAGESSFVQRRIDLSQFANRLVNLRFVYDVEGKYYTPTLTVVGWYIDNIQFENVDQVSSDQITTTTSASFNFAPAAAENYVLIGRARTGHSFLPWGFGKVVQGVATTAPEFRIASLIRSRFETQLTVDLTAGSAPGWTVESKTKLSDQWAGQSATVETVSPTRYLLKLPNASSTTAFYRVRAN